MAEPLWLWFDFDGVVGQRRGSRAELVGRTLGLDPAICRAAYYDQLSADPAWRRRSLATTTDEAEHQLFVDLFADLAKRHHRPVSAEALDRLATEFITINRFEVAPGWTEFAEAMKGVAYLGLLTNAYPSRRHYELPELDVEFDFDDIIISCEVGLEKPDPSIFQLAVQRSGQAPAESWLIDNETRHLVGAESAGFGRTILYGEVGEWPMRVKNFAELEQLVRAR